MNRLYTTLSRAIVGLALSCTHAIHAEEPQHVPLCMTDFPPYVSEALPDGGSLTALARRAFAAGGLAVRPLHVPLVRALQLARNGECVLMAVWRSADLDAEFKYSLPVAVVQLGFFVRVDQKGELPPDATVAYQRASYLPPELKNGKYKLHALADTRPGAEMLKRGHVDAVFTERETFEYVLRQQPNLAELIRWQAPGLEVKQTFMAVGKQHPQAEYWLELLNQEIRQSRMETVQTKSSSVRPQKKRAPKLKS